MSLEWDWETRGVPDLTKRGPYIYAAHPHTDALLASYRMRVGSTGSAVDAYVAAGGGIGQLCRWKRGQPCPAPVRAYVEAGGVISAHNAAFERLIWWLVMVRKHGWPKPTIEQFRCTAVTAAAMSLPRSLDRLAAALDLSEQKDKRGKELIKKLSIPQTFLENGDPIWNDDPALLDEFHDYCDQDINTEGAADDRLIPLSDYEQAVYVLNERINDRGIRIDVPAAKAALLIIEKAKEKINAELAALTGGRVAAVTQTAKLKTWIAAQGVEMPSMDKDDVDEFLHEVDDLPDRVRRALELRQEGAKPSVEKIVAMLARVCTDWRARGVYLDHGAGQTGRFSSRGLQAHNMPKYRKEFEALFEKGLLRLDVLFDVIRTGEPAMLEFMYGPKLGRPLHILSDAVRSFIIAEPGHEFINADFTSIEGVKAAWFAKEEWKLQAFRDLIAGTGPGMYELFAATGIYNVPVGDITKPQRAVGKVGELSMGYQGGAGALAKMARQNKLKLSAVYPSLWESSTPERREKALERLEERTEKHDPHVARLGREGWLAAELIKVGWRGAHPNIVAAWKDLDGAAKQAVESPGRVVPALFGRVAYIVAHGFLWCRLPSGRCLAYGRPKFAELDAPWADPTLEPKKREKVRSLTVLGVDAQTEKWVRFPVYGGRLFNNVVQGSSRDVLVHGMLNAERAGYPLVLHTHDECMAELPIGQGNVEEFKRIICDLPLWCRDVPLKAEGWVGKRYHK